MSASPALPRTVWMLWLQGLPAAPAVVRACHASWRAHNPGWQVVVLDEGSLREHLELPRDAVARGGVSPQVLSDLVRVNLLADRGGVWADATCLCRRPLDAWLDACLPSGFFAFRNPGSDRLLSSWFLAACPGSRLAGGLRDEVNAYWGLGRGALRTRRRLPARVERLLRDRPALRRLWFSWAPLRGSGRYPYFWFHYLFAELLRRDPACREEWERTPDRPASGPHRLLKAGLCSPLTEELRRVIDAAAVPVHKLTWKRGVDRCPPGSVLDYLLGRPPLGAAASGKSSR